MLLNCSKSKFECSNNKLTEKVNVEDLLEELKNLGIPEEGCNNY